MIKDKGANSLAIERYKEKRFLKLDIHLKQLLMIQFTDSLKRKLLAINVKESDTLKKAEEITPLLKNAFNYLRLFIHEYEFKDESEDILFFKEIKPILFCDLIYYQKMYNLEIHCSAGGYSELMVYFEKELFRIIDFFDKNKAFYRYCRSDNIYGL